MMSEVTRGRVDNESNSQSRYSNISEYGSEHMKAVCTGREIQECYVGTRFPFDSNPIQNKSPARRTLYLVVSVMQSFKATCWLPKTKHKTILEQFFQHDVSYIQHISQEKFFPLRPYADLRLMT